MNRSDILTRAIRRYQETFVPQYIEVEIYDGFYEFDRIWYPKQELKFTNVIPDGMCRFRRYFFTEDTLYLICENIPMTGVLENFGRCDTSDLTPILSLALDGALSVESLSFHESERFYDLFTLEDTIEIPEPIDGVYHARD